MGCGTSTQVTPYTAENDLSCEQDFRINVKSIRDTFSMSKGTSRCATLLKKNDVPKCADSVIGKKNTGPG